MSTAIERKRERDRIRRRLERAALKEKQDTRGAAAPPNNEAPAPADAAPAPAPAAQPAPKPLPEWAATPEALAVTLAGVEGLAVEFARKKDLGVVFAESLGWTKKDKDGNTVTTWELTAATKLAHPHLGPVFAWGPEDVPPLLALTIAAALLLGPATYEFIRDALEKRSKKKSAKSDDAARSNGAAGVQRALDDAEARA